MSTNQPRNETDNAASMAGRVHPYAAEIEAERVGWYLPRLREWVAALIAQR